MTRTLPAKPSLDYLKHEAKSIHKHFKAKMPDVCDTLRHLARFTDRSNVEILAEEVKLLEVQQALAVDYGFLSWKDLKAHVESRLPRISRTVPAFGITSYEQAVAHYIDWLGFKLEWEWREAPGQPVIMALSLHGFELMLNEHESAAASAGANVHLNVTNLAVLAEEWNARRPGSAKIQIEPPYEFPDLPITDPFGNTLVFEDNDKETMDARQEAVAPKMREYIQQLLDAGNGLPTPEQVRDEVGPPLGIAIEVLNEFPGYREAFEARQNSSEHASPASASRGLPSHLDLSVSDISASITFYNILLVELGFQRFRADDKAWQEPDPSRAAWTIKYRDGRAFGIDLRLAVKDVGKSYDRLSPGPHHLAFNVDSDDEVEKIHQAMTNVGTKVLDLPHNYGGQAGYGGHYCAVFFADPDGFKVEVVHAIGFEA